jgi:protein-S-isoprenylcysteine O-methyltransferase Ste14
MWILVVAITVRWRGLPLYENSWAWIPAGVLFCAGMLLYRLSHNSFSLTQLSGLPEILPNHSHQRLVTAGIRAHIRHPVYLGHLCEMLAWSLGTGLVICWGLTAFAVVTGSLMIALEDAELEKRFGEEYLRYRSTVPAIVPMKRIKNRSGLI